MPKKIQIGNGLFGNIDASAGSLDAEKKVVKKKNETKKKSVVIDSLSVVSSSNNASEFVELGSRFRGNDNKEHVFQIAEFIEILNTFFKKQEARITGEVTELKHAMSGHVYFTVKDKNGGAALDCIVWGRNYQMCGVRLEVGMEVILSGHPNVYAASGRLSFVADTIELVGEGALKKAYDALKKKLEAEGVFALERKRALPEFVRKVGVITSLKGAVIHDFENNLGKFGFIISVCDSRVEGQQAVKSILAALAALRGMDIEALVVIRGGGSLESLQAFNNEAVVRAIVDFPVPVIAGIGHDQDVPLGALAADFMTSTPTAAAHLLGRSWEEAFAKVDRLRSVFIRFEEMVRRIRNNLDGVLGSMFDGIAHRITSFKDQLQYAEKMMVLNDPTRQLKLGYAIVRAKGKILKSVRDIAKGELLETQLADGTIQSKVENL